jgi:diguanylate cyclase (GGDEF)-like protein/PAS domain S-box-containing protein
MNGINHPSHIETQSFFSFKSFSKVVSLFVIGVGCLVLAGWALDTGELKSILPGQENMKSNTALLFVLCGLSLWMQVRERAQPIAQVCAFVVTLAGLLTLAEYLFNSDLGIDQILFRDTSAGVIYPGRMAPVTAMVFILTGSNLLFIDGRARNIFKESLVIMAIAICGLALIGYLYGVSSLYQIGIYTSMAWHTALSFIMLSMGILFARTERGIMQNILADTAGGSILRRFLPTAIMAPIFLGWISLWGQRAGLYDTALSLALMTISLITTLVIFIGLNARELTGIDIKRRQVDDSLRASEVRFRSTLENMMEGCQIIGYDWRYLYINKTAEKHNHRPNSELLGNVYMDMWPGIEATAMFPLLRRCMDERTPQRMLNEFTYPSGSLGWFELNIQPVPDGIFILSGDVTDRKRAEQALLEREMKLSKLFEILPVGISILDAEGNVTFTNPALKNILDISDEGLLKGTYTNRKYLRNDGTFMPVDELVSVRALKENREIADVETGVIKEDGSIVWTDVNAVPVNFRDWKVVMVTSDITERKHAEMEIFKLNADLEQKVADRTAELAAANEQLHELAVIDELTGLYNRRGFLLFAEQQLMLAQRTRRNLLVIYGDLDGLKQINDQFGHAAGDEAIITTARTLHEAFRASDIKARLGGDEFIILAVGVDGDYAQVLIARLKEKLAENNQSISVGVVSVDAQKETSIDDLIARADEAMYVEKRTKPGHNDM